MGYNEKAFLQQIADGDPNAYKTLFEQHYQALCYFAQSITGNKEEAEDLVQESFQKLWDRKDRFDNGLRIKAFLFITTRNACFNHLKQQQRLKQREQAFANNIAAYETQPIEQFDPLVSEAEVLQALHAEIERLPAQCKRIFKMSYVEGIKNEAIAASLGLSYNTVRAQKLRALKLLRAALLTKNSSAATCIGLAWISLQTWHA